MGVFAGTKNWVKGVWRRSNLHRAMLVAPPVVLLVLAGFWTFGSGEPVQYYTAKVEKGDIQQVVQSTGTINAVTTVQVGSQVSGIIAEIFVDFNSKVRRGQTIAQIDPSILRARLQQAEADLANAQANVRNIEAQIETQRADLIASQATIDRARAQANEAQLQLKRTSELFTQGIMSEAQRDTAQANADSAVASQKVTEAQLAQAQARLRGMQASLEQARAQVQQRRAAADLARVDLGHAVITAPIDGTVIARNVDVGQTVAASLQAPTLFIIAQDLTKMLVYAKTDEADVGKIKVGAKAEFRVDSFPRERFTGTVTQVRMNATTVQNVVTYDTIIEFDNPQQKLFPGMTAYVTIPVAWANDVVKIPNGALRFRPTLEEEERKALYEKHGIPYVDPRNQRLAGSASAQGGQRPGGAGGSGGRPGGEGGAAAGGGGAGGERGGQRAGGEGQRGGEAAAAGGAQGGERRTMGGPGGGMAGGGFGGMQPTVVWKLVNKKDLVPVRVRLGVTDFTFTELREGKIEPGEELIIGASGGRSNAAAAAAGRPPGMGASPMGGPGGMRRF